LQLKQVLSAIPFSTVESNSIKETAVGKGSVLLGGNLEAVLTSAKVRKERMASSGLAFIRKRNTEGNVYFISNPSKSFDGWVPLQTKSASVSVFNPMSEKTGIGKIRNNTDGIEVYLKLDSGESCILQTSSAMATGNPYAFYKATGSAQEITGTWNVKFLSGGPALPKPMQTSALRSWTEMTDDALKSFSGTAEYSIRFNKPAGSASAWILDLGRVEESADVLLNNKKIATLIGPSYRVVLPASALLANNILQVQVTSGMANRIILLEKKGVQWKKFYNVNFPSRLPANRGTDGIFTAAKWEPLASGLIGPVTLTPAGVTE
jgi:hypothetical protein